MTVPISNPAAGSPSTSGTIGTRLVADGSKVMFFSARDLFSIDLFLADTATGKIIRKVTDTATDAHFESLQFLESAGAWDATGNRFVFPGVPATDLVVPHEQT